MGERIKYFATDQYPQVLKPYFKTLQTLSVRLTLNVQAEIQTELAFLHNAE